MNSKTRRQPLASKQGEDCVDPAAAEEAADAINKLEDVLHDAEHALGSKLPEGTNDEIVSAVAVALDGPKQRDAEDAAQRALGKLRRSRRKAS